MIPIVTISRDEMEERYPRAVHKAVQEIREDVAKIEYVPPRNRHERRKAEALARRVAR